MKNKVKFLKVKFLSVIAIIAVIAVALLGASVDASAKTPKKIKMAVGTSLSKTDVGWGQGMHEAYLYIKEHYSDSIDVTFSEKIPWPDLPTFLKTQDALGTELVFLDSACTWGEALRAVAAKTPDTWYVCSGSDAECVASVPSNVRAYSTHASEGAFMAGVAAGAKTKTNKVAFLGSMDYPSIVALSAAFELGAKWINPDAEMLSQFVGSFNDPEKGYESANALIANGVDVIFMWASESGLGGVKACKQKGVWVIGSAVDQSHLAPEIYITSVLMPHWHHAAMGIAEYKAGILQHGLIRLRVMSGAQMLAPLTNVSKDIKAKVEKARTAMFRELIIVPMIYDTSKIKHLSPGDCGIRSLKELKEFGIE